MYRVKLVLFLTILFCYQVTEAQQETSSKKTKKTYHYICPQNPDREYHNNDHCSRLLLCSGGRVRRINDVSQLKPCKKCIKKVAAAPAITTGRGDFRDIKRVLGVKDKKQIADSLGTAEGTIHRPEGFSVRISGLPGSATVNTLEFFFDTPIVFNEDTLFSEKFLDKLGLDFTTCKADTIRNTTPHPVTGKIKKDVTIEYRGCAIVERRDNYEDLSKYYYELLFVAKEGTASAEVEKIQLNLKVESR